MTPTSRKQKDPDQQLLLDVQSYVFEARDGMTFPDLIASFPGVPVADLIAALIDLEANKVVTFVVRHRANHPKA